MDNMKTKDLVIELMKILTTNSLEYIELMKQLKYSTPYMEVEYINETPKVFVRIELFKDDNSLVSSYTYVVNRDKFISLQTDILKEDKN